MTEAPAKRMPAS